MKSFALKKLLQLVIMIVLFQFSFAQPSQIKRTWHWYFGNGAGIDFSSGMAVADTNGQLYTSEGCSSISDTAGNLLFYTDGRTIWNRLHQVMPNGTGLMGGADGSSTQEALIVPKPLSDNLYYVFTTDELANYGSNGLRYTVVDMNLNGGLGDADITQKNVLLFAPCTEKLAAVNHCNDTAVWVVGHELNNNHFRAYLFTSNGIDTNAVISAAGGTMGHNGGMAGCLKFSPNGKKICTGSDSLLRRIQLFDFDNSSGIISNGFTVFFNDSYTLAITFSPDGTKLYVGLQGANTELYQFDISFGDSAAIVSTQTNIASLFNWGFWSLQNGPDGKIYSCHSALILEDSSLDVINSPNIAGAGCGFQFDAVKTNTWFDGLVLPNFNESYFDPSNDSACVVVDFVEDIESEVRVFPNPARDWIEIGGSETLKSFLVVDSYGRIYFNESNNLAPSDLRLNVASLPRGFYFFIMITANRILPEKILLN